MGVASLLRKGWVYLKAPSNAAKFALRRRVGLGRGRPVLGNESKAGLFDYLTGADRDHAEARRVELEERYQLEALAQLSTRRDYRDNLYQLDGLEQAMSGVVDGGDVGPRRCVIDVGSKNFNYAFALERFFGLQEPGEPRQVSVTGIEIDGNGLYKDLSRRADHAAAYAGQATHHAVHDGSVVQYRVADYLQTQLPPADVVTLFYPFLTRYALLQWGLPMRCFQPEAILRKALDDLRTGGRVLVFNQTERERDLLARLAESVGALVEHTLPLRSKLVDYWERTQGRFATRLSRS